MAVGDPMPPGEFSAERRTLLRKCFDAFNRHEPEEWADLFHTDATLVPTPHWAPPGTVYRGRPGMRTYGHQVFGRLPDLRATVRQRMHEIGDSVVGEVLVTAGKDEPPDAGRTVGVIYAFKDGKIIWAEGFPSEAEARAAARWRAAVALRAPGASGRPHLTSREREVFRLLALGLTGPEVADRLVLSPHTVRRHVEKGIARLEARNRVQAIAIALTSGEVKL